MHGISLCRKQLGRSTGWLRPAAGGAGHGARDCMRSGTRELDQLARACRTAMRLQHPRECYPAVPSSAQARRATCQADRRNTTSKPTAISRSGQPLPNAQTAPLAASTATPS